VQNLKVTLHTKFEKIKTLKMKILKAKPWKIITKNQTLHKSSKVEPTHTMKTLKNEDKKPPHKMETLL
jgi:hypothetical protein